MAIDLLIFGVLLISFVINLLALGAFWVTPGLRTTANRFTINLLIINLIGCLILAPTLFLATATTTSTASSSNSPRTVERATGFLSDTKFGDDSIEFYSKPGNHQMTIKHNGKLIEQDGIILQQLNVTSNGFDGAGGGGSSPDGRPVNNSEPRTIETIYKCNTVLCKELTIDESSDTIVITEIEEQSHFPDFPGAEAEHKDDIFLRAAGGDLPEMRCWSIDLAAALGSLAVLLIVADTWCAVTDPLRYHTRVSGVKSWVFIALTWIVGLIFGSLSAFRSLDFESDTLIDHRRHLTETYFSLTTSNGIFGLVFAGLYFVVIIMLPFGFVCGMYWRIFSEARENGLRMRQNGSSPLLQSALNLNNHHQHQQQQQQHGHGHGHGHAHQYSNSLCVQRNSISSAASSQGMVGGLQMQIDHQKSSPQSLRRDSTAKVLLLPTISDDDDDDDDVVSVNGGGGAASALKHHTASDRNQNIILTLQAASGEIKRNYSARQLPLLGTSSQDFRETAGLQGIRQVHSSPNLQRYTQIRPEESSPHLLGGHAQRLPMTVARHHHQQQQHFERHNRSGRSLQIPAANGATIIQGSPKTLSYMSSLRHRLSNASSLFKYREESRAARISILVVIMFLVSYLPYGCLVLLQSRLAAANFPHSTQLAVLMILLANLSSPFIFAYRNKRVRRGLKRLFGLEARCRLGLQRQSTSSVRESGGLRVVRSMGNMERCNSGTSCKYLTPQSSLVSNTTTVMGVSGGGGGELTTVPLRPNTSSSTIINFHVPPQSADASNAEQQPIVVCKTRPTLQRGVTIVEHIPIEITTTTHPTNAMPPSTTTTTTTTNAGNYGGAAPHKYGLFKLLFKGSKSLSYAATRSCTDTTDQPTEV